MGFALFAPSGKSGKKYYLRFLRQAAKVAKYKSCDLRFLRPAAKVAKKYESWDLRFLRQAEKVAKVRIMGFALFAPSGKNVRFAKKV